MKAREISCAERRAETVGELGEVGGRQKTSRNACCCCSGKGKESRFTDIAGLDSAGDGIVGAWSGLLCVAGVRCRQCRDRGESYRTARSLGGNLSCAGCLAGAECMACAGSVACATCVGCVHCERAGCGGSDAAIDKITKRAAGFMRTP